MMFRVLALLLAAPAFGSSQPLREAMLKSDFSSVETLESAKALVVRGRLVPVLLFPAEFGGEQAAVNTVYVTREAAATRAKIVETLARMIEGEEVDKMEVIPAYKGRSFVPSSITMHAWHSKKAGEFEAVVVVW